MQAALLFKKISKPALILSFAVLAISIVALTAHMLLPQKQAGVSLACEELAQDDQLQCFADEIILLAQNIGITPAIRRASEVLSSSPGLQNECHAIMHSIGEEAYVLYKNGAPLDVTPSITMCTYGFYHGFINSAVLEEGSFEPAQAFCAYVNAELSSQGIESEAECYHGFGHAVVDDHVSTEFLTAKEVAEQALLLCGDLSSEDLHYINCASGVYNAISNVFMDRSFPWPEIDADNPMSYCESQPAELEGTCYGYFARVLFLEHESALAPSLAAVTEAVAKEHQTGVIENLALMLTLTNPDKSIFKEAIEDCRLLSAPLSGNCIAGLAVGIAQSAETSRLYESASLVCKDVRLTHDEKVQCFNSLLLNLKPLISRDEFKTICSQEESGEKSPWCEV